MSVMISTRSEFEVPYIENNNYGSKIKSMPIHPFISPSLPTVDFTANIGTLGNFGAEEVFLYYNSCGLLVEKLK
jgi:hypothetical protein